MDGALTDMAGGAPQDADLSGPVVVPGASAVAPALTGDQHPLATDDSYEGKFGQTLRALDQRVQTSKAAAQTAQQAAAATRQAAMAAADRHVAVASEQQRRMGALGGDQQNAGPQGALPGNQPAMSLQQYLDSHDDDTYKEASDMVKQKHGQSPDELYDKMIADKFVPPADVPLTKRQKGEAFMHMGLEILKNSSSKPGQGDIVGALGKGGEAGLADMERSHQQAAQQAHEEYLREQGLTLDKAKEGMAREKDEATANRQLAGDRVKNSEDWRKIQYTQGQENARSAAANAAHLKEAREKTGDKNVQLSKDDQGYQLERDPATNRWVQSTRMQPVLDENGQPKIGKDGRPIQAPQPFKTIDQEKVDKGEADKAKAADAKSTAARAAYITKAKTGIAAYKDDGTQKTDEELGAEYDALQKKPGAAGASKTVQFSSWK